MVQAVHAAEVGDTTLSGHPRAAEKDDMPALADPVLKLFELMVHKSASLLRADVGIGPYVLRGGSGCGAGRASAAPAPPLALQTLVETVDQVGRRPYDQRRHTGIYDIFLTSYHPQRQESRADRPGRSPARRPPVASRWRPGSIWWSSSPCGWWTPPPRRAHKSRTTPGRIGGQGLWKVLPRAAAIAAPLAVTEKP